MSFVKLTYGNSRLFLPLQLEESPKTSSRASCCHTPNSMERLRDETNVKLKLGTGERVGFDRWRKVLKLVIRILNSPSTQIKLLDKMILSNKTFKST